MSQMLPTLVETLPLDHGITFNDLVKLGKYEQRARQASEKLEQLKATEDGNTPAVTNARLCANLASFDKLAFELEKGIRS